MKRSPAKSPLRTEIRPNKSSKRVFALSWRDDVMIRLAVVFRLIERFSPRRRSVSWSTSPSSGWRVQRQQCNFGGASSIYKHSERREIVCFLDSNNHMLVLKGLLFFFNNSFVLVIVLFRMLPFVLSKTVGQGFTEEQLRVPHSAHFLSLSCFFLGHFRLFVCLFCFSAACSGDRPYLSPCHHLWVNLLFKSAFFFWVCFFGE